MSLSLYLHIPFCTHRCAYCDFNTYAGQESQIPSYVEALCAEIAIVGENSPAKRDAHTVFFGGGTPSLLSPAQFAQILRALRKSFNLLPDAELTFEANPGTVTADALSALRAAGLNRISYGVQSANPDELRQLERAHTFSDVLDAVRWSRQAGFANLNLDLIYGLPEQSLLAWEKTIAQALLLQPEHLSLYALTLEPGTPFGRWARKGLLPIPDSDLAADMADFAGEALRAAGYIQYEISNWALPGYECQHNLQYWRNRDYLGFGAGAHGYADGVRYANVARIRTYVERLAKNTSPEFPLSSATASFNRNTLRENMQETMLTGLRLTSAGVSGSDFKMRYGMEIEQAFPKEVQTLLRRGLLEWAGDCLRLTPVARMIANQVFQYFVD